MQTPARERRQPPSSTLPALFGEALALAGDLQRLAWLEARLALRALLALAGLLPLVAAFALGAWLCLQAALWQGTLALGAPAWLAALALLGAHAFAFGLAWRGVRRCWHRASLPRLRASLRELRGGLAP